MALSLDTLSPNTDIFLNLSIYTHWPGTDPGDVQGLGTDIDLILPLDAPGLNTFDSDLYLILPIDMRWPITNLDLILPVETYRPNTSHINPYLVLPIDTHWPDTDLDLVLPIDTRWPHDPIAGSCLGIFKGVTSTHHQILHGSIHAHSEEITT